MSLTVEQLGGAPVTGADHPVPVMAWVPWTDGGYHLVDAVAGEWTSSAVHLRWLDGSGVLRDVWVWAAGVRRRPSFAGGSGS